MPSWGWWYTGRNLAITAETGLERCSLPPSSPWELGQRPLSWGLGSLTCQTSDLVSVSSLTWDACGLVPLVNLPLLGTLRTVGVFLLDFMELKAPG